MAENTYQPMARAALTVGVPLSVVRRLVNANAIPCLRIGRRVLLDPASVKAALDRLADESQRVAARRAEGVPQ